MHPVSRDMAASGALGMLFAEDFDDPPGVTILDDAADDGARDGGAPRDATSADPEPAPPALDIDAERDAAFARGRDAALAGIAAAAARHQGEQARLLGEIAALLRDAETVARTIAERSADAVARLTLGALAAILPAACARHGADEAAAVARAVLPALNHAPEITVLASADTLPALADAIGALDPRLRARIDLSASAHVAPGDVRITWPDGEAARDGAALWRDVTEALARFGLFEMPASDE